MIKLFSIILILVSVSQIQAYETMFFRCDGRTIDIIGDSRPIDKYNEVEVLEINVEDDKIRWDNYEDELYDSFFVDGEAIIYKENRINIQLELDKRTGILKELKQYPRQKLVFEMTYSCQKISSETLW